MLDFIAKPLGQFLYFIYNTIAFENYGIALIIFTIVVKLVLLPLTVKQYKSTARMQEIQPQIQEIQKRYKNDKEKLNQELMKVYSENKVNPAGGCLPLIIQMPILFSLFYVIRRPLYYVFGEGNQIIFQAAEKIGISVQGIEFSELLNKFAVALNLKEKDPYLEVNIINGLHEKGITLLNMDFLKIFNLGIIPKWKINELMAQPGVYIPLLLIPILAVATTYLSSKLMMSKNTSTTNANDTANAMQKNMMYLGPAMTLIFSFQFPAGLGLYWTISNLVQIFQQMYINKHVLKKEVVNK